MSHASGLTNTVDSIKLPAVYDDLSPQERRNAREAYADAQGGLCHHCKAPLSGPPAPRVASIRVTRRLYPVNFFKYPVHLHHNRKTGLTIGAVHNHCNAVLWEHYSE